MKAWVNDLNTTNFRIVVSIALTAFAVVVCFAGVTFLHWEPSEKQITVLEGIAIVLLTMMGFDVLQFWSKRSTDAGLAAAKNPSQPVQASVTTVDTEKTPNVDFAAKAKTLDPDLQSALQIGADRDARLAAGTLPAREE